ncbi:MAG: HAD family phosphatase [Bacteroidetes bacterium]|nr:HAD family phosphatase [Bacteroidota bacterium]
MPVETIIWDLGGVLIDWKTTYVFDEHYFDSLEKRKIFFDTVCTNDWNENQDAGYPIAQATAEKITEFPQWESAIRDFYGRWEEMLHGPIQETVDVFQELRATQQYKFYALTNWSAETFPIALKRFNFLHWFDGRIVSGEEKTRKPFPKFYQILLDRYQLNPETSLFIDDNLRNVKAAEALRIPSIHFKDALQLRADLMERGV